MYSQILCCFFHVEVSDMSWDETMALPVNQAVHQAGPGYECHSTVYYCACSGVEALRRIQTTALVCAAQANSPPHFPSTEETVILV
jgi:hypothetical protein